MTALVGLIIFTGTALERYTWMASSYSTHIHLSAMFDWIVVIVIGALVLLSWHAGSWAEPRMYQKLLGNK